MNRRNLDISVSGILTVIPVILMAMTFTEQFDVPTFGGDVGPAFAPRAYFVVWFLLTAVAFFAAFRSRPEEPAAPDHGLRTMQLLGTMGVVLATTIAMINIGFVFATIPGFLLFGLAFGYRRKAPLLVLSVAAPVIIWALFTFVFELVLPKSPWFHML